MSVQESTLQTWSQAPSETEENRCRNAVNAITAAVEAVYGNRVDIFLQGSYRNRTNVRKDSDVDVVVRHREYFYTDAAALPLLVRPQVPTHYRPTNYQFWEFKQSIQEILSTHFGSPSIERKNKCIRVKENTYRVSADVVPAFTHHVLPTPSEFQHEGTGLFADNAPTQQIFSFPKQHYDNGAAKNTNTSGNYKGLVRILKRTRNAMVDAGLMDKDLMPSHFLESLLWNVPDAAYTGSSWTAVLRSVLPPLYADMKGVLTAAPYHEVNGLKLLFDASSGRTPTRAMAFMEGVWEYITL